MSTKVLMLPICSCIIIFMTQFRYKSELFLNFEQSNTFEPNKCPLYLSPPTTCVAICSPLIGLSRVGQAIEDFKDFTFVTLPVVDLIKL